jgi:hypothetical protein
MLARNMFGHSRAVDPPPPVATAIQVASAGVQPENRDATVKLA